MRSRRRNHERLVLRSDSHRMRTAFWCALAVIVASVLPHAQQPSLPCRVAGRITSGTTPLPGVALVATSGGKVIAATSTALDGSYELGLPHGGHQLEAQLTGFTTAQRSLALTGDPCTALATNIQLSLEPRTTRVAAAPAGGAAGRFETLNVEIQQAAGSDPTTTRQSPPMAAPR